MKIDYGPLLIRKLPRPKPQPKEKELPPGPTSFKVGDRVKCKADLAGENPHLLAGYKGTIRCIDHSQKLTTIGVEWDKNILGHFGMGCWEGQAGHCWFVSENEIELLPPEPGKEEPQAAAPFKIGDRVVCIKEHVNNPSLKAGDKGTIRELLPSHPYPIGVECDRAIGGHSGLGFFQGKNRHCWFVTESQVELLPPEPKKETLPEKPSEAFSPKAFPLPTPPEPKKATPQIWAALEYPPTNVYGKTLQGLSFCITGTLSLTRDAVNHIIGNHSGYITNSVTKNLDYLVVGPKPGAAKLKKAESLGIKTLTEHQFLVLLNNGPPIPKV